MRCIRLIAPIALLLCPGEAAADATLLGLASREVREVSHDTTIDFYHDRIAVRQSITLAARGRGPAEALYTFDLPVHAALHHASAHPSNVGATRFAVVDAQTTVRDDFGGLTVDAGADVGLLRMVRDDDSGGERARKTYELRVFPVSPRNTVRVDLHWEAPVHRVAGFLHVRIPGRGQANNLVRQSIRVRARAPLAQVFAPGHSAQKKVERLPTGASFRFGAPARGDIVLQASLPGSTQRIAAEIGLVPFGSQAGAAVVRVAMPPARLAPAAEYTRILLAVDVSRSSVPGRAATEKIVDELLGTTGSGVEVEAVLFDRKARRVLGAIQPADRAVRSALKRAIGSAGRKNGSDLGAALELIGQINEKAAPAAGRTLVAIISDGMFSTRFEPDDALNRIGAHALKTTQVVDLVLVPDKAPLPDLSTSSLSTLVQRTGGRSLPLHFSAALAESNSMLELMTRAAPLRRLKVDLGEAEWVGASMPRSLQSGTGLLALGFYRGKRPARPVLVATRNGRRVTIRLRAMSKSRAQSFARMALANAVAGTFPMTRGDGTRTSARLGDHDRARLQMLRAAHKLGVVTRESAGIVVDKSDGFALDRIALAKKWGPEYYRRVRPLPERASQHSFRAFSSSSAPKRGTGSARTGNLGPGLLGRLIQQHVVPNARRCYNRLLRSDSRAAGNITLYFELARGEVHHASIERSPSTLRSIHGCILDAAYAIPVPRVRVGGDPELISIARYPLRFRFSRSSDTKRKPVVESGPAPSPTGALDPNDPLSGLPAED